MLANFLSPMKFIIDNNVMIRVAAPPAMNSTDRRIASIETARGTLEKIPLLVTAKTP